MRDVLRVLTGILLIIFLAAFMTACGKDSSYLTPPTGDSGGDNGGSTTEDTTAPTVPAGLTATAAGSNRIDLAWSPSTDNVGVAGYKIYRNSVYVATASGVSYSDTGLEPDTEYCYSVAAYDSAGNQSDYSELVCATTEAEVVAGEWKLPYNFIGYSVVADADGNVYIGGGYDSSTGNPFIARINNDGRVGWIQTIRGTAGVDRGNGIAISQDGDSVYFKYYFDIFNESSTGYEEFVAKLDSATGAVVWSHKLSTVCGTNGPIGSIHTLPDGKILAAGRNCFITVADNGVSASEVFVSPNLPPSADVAVSADGRAVFTAENELIVDGGSDVAVKKYDSGTGEVLWERTWRRPLNPEIESQYNIYWNGESICATPGGTIFVGTSGWYYSGEDFVHLPADIIRYDEEGNLLGTTSYGALPIGAAVGMDCDQSNAYFGVYVRALYAMDENGGIVWSNPSGSGTHSTDGVSVNPTTGVVYEVIDNTVRRFDAQTGDEILP